MACCVAMAAAPCTPCNTELDVPPVYIIYFKAGEQLPNESAGAPRGESLSVLRACGVHSGGWRA